MRSLLPGPLAQLVKGTLEAADRSLSPGSLSGKRVTVAGGGYAGLKTARALAAGGASVELIDPKRAHVPVTQLPDLVAGHTLEVPFAPLAQRRGYAFTQGKVTGVSPERREIALDTADGRELTLDYGDALVLAMGAQAAPTGGARPFRLAEDAFALRNELEARIALAGGAPIRVAIAGSGLGGIELAGAIQSTFGKQVEVLVAGHGVRLPTANADLSLLARQKLEQQGVHVLEGVDVTPQADGLRLVRQADSATGWAAADVTVDAFRAPGAARGMELAQPDGRIATDGTLRIPGTSVWVAGDGGTLGPQSAPAAKAQGALVAWNIGEALAGREGAHYQAENPGFIASVGPDAVGEVNVAGESIPLSGLPASTLKKLIERWHLAGL